MRYRLQKLLRRETASRAQRRLLLNTAHAAPQSQGVRGLRVVAARTTPTVTSQLSLSLSPFLPLWCSLCLRFTCCECAGPVLALAWQWASALRARRERGGSARRRRRRLTCQLLPPSSLCPRLHPLSLSQHPDYPTA
eukprot:904873-Rhodomonas_salina.1